MAEIENSLSEIGNSAKQEQKQLRIELVRRLLVRGVKQPKEIKTSLESMNPPVSLSIRTIHRYLNVITRQNNKQIREKEGLNKTIEEMALELKQTFEEVSREMWRQYHAPIVIRVKCPHPEHRVGKLACGLVAEAHLNQAMVKVAALKEIRETASKNLEVMQSLGLVNKAPEKHQMVDKDGNPIDPVSNDKAVLNQQFIAFINSMYKDPVGANKGEVVAEQKAPANEQTETVSS